MAYSGINPPNNMIVAGGDPFIQELKVEVATNMYPGRAVIKGTNDDDVIVADGIAQAIGVLGYEQCNPAFRPTNIDTIYEINAMVPVLKGSGFLNSPGGLAVGTYAYKGDFLLSWAGGQFVPAISVAGRLALKIPFSKNTSEKTTGVRLPAGSVVRDVGVRVDDNVAASTIDVGTLSTDSGDADGFLDGESCASAGYVIHNAADGTAANITVGALLEEVELKDANTIYYGVPTGYVVPAGGKIVSYTTSDHDISGDILIFLEGSVAFGQVEKTVSAMSAAADVLYKLLI
jgi:hypothetical protein